MKEEMEKKGETHKYLKDAATKEDRLNIIFSAV